MCWFRPWSMWIQLCYHSELLSCNIKQYLLVITGCKVPQCYLFLKIHTVQWFLSLLWFFPPFLERSPAFRLGQLQCFTLHPTTSCNMVMVERIHYLQMLCTDENKWRLRNNLNSRHDNNFRTIMKYFQRVLGCIKRIGAFLSTRSSSKPDILYHAQTLCCFVCFLNCFLRGLLWQWISSVWFLIDKMRFLTSC